MRLGKKRTVAEVVAQAQADLNVIADEATFTSQKLDEQARDLMARAQHHADEADRAARAVRALEG